MMTMCALVNFLGYNYGLVSCICMINDQFYTDVDECLEEGVCPAGSRCMNTIGSYTCTCDAGYMNDGNACNGKFLN